MPRLQLATRVSSVVAGGTQKSPRAGSRATWNSTATSVPVPVLTSALYARFALRGGADVQNRLPSAMRHAFGGHVEPEA